MPSSEVRMSLDRAVKPWQQPDCSATDHNTNEPPTSKRNPYLTLSDLDIALDQAHKKQLTISDYLIKITQSRMHENTSKTRPTTQ